MDLKKLTSNARLHLSKNWSVSILGSLISIVLWSLIVLRFYGVGSVLWIFILFLPFMVGISRYHYSLSYPKKGSPKDFIYGFHEKTYFRSLGGLALKYFYLFWWTLFFIVPGIYKAISYAMTTYILQDPDFSHLNTFQVITKSRKIMNGHKSEYLVLFIRFIPLFLLSVLTLGIGLFYTLPYYEQTKAEFYRELEKEEF